MGTSEKEDTTEFIEEIKNHFRPQSGFAANYKVVMEEKKTPLIIEVNGGTLQCFYGEGNRADVEMQISRESFENIIMGRNTFQSSFMAGDMKMKGDFKVLRGLDQVLIFGSRTME